MINAVLDLLAPARGAGEYWVVGVSLRDGLVSCASVAVGAGESVRSSVRVGAVSDACGAAVKAFVLRNAPFWARRNGESAATHLCSALSMACARGEPTALAVFTLARSVAGGSVIGASGRALPSPRGGRHDDA